ncbi:MAG: guanylate kinase, partial [Candidatus Omnitrophica bacterium]|nr:guanylate kinase [Candidatus Omnitrophota bacterium]
MRRQGLIFVISGPSGSGKTTLLGALLKSPGLQKKLAKSISLTTRPKRSGEREGRDYFFISRSEFRKRRKEKKILEQTR